MDSNDCFCIALNEDRVEEADRLLCCLEHFHPDVPVVAGCVAFDGRGLQHGLLEVRPVDIPHTPGAIVCHRARLVMDLLLEGAQRVIYLDTDTLVRRDLNGLWGLMVSPNTLAVRFRADRAGDALRAFQAGVVGVSAGPHTLSMVSRWVEFCGSMEWWADQVGLWKAYVEQHKQVALAGFGWEFNDYSMHDESAVWHAKGGCYRREAFEAEALAWVRGVEMPQGEVDPFHGASVSDQVAEQEEPEAIEPVVPLDEPPTVFCWYTPEREVYRVAAGRMEEQCRALGLACVIWEIDGEGAGWHEMCQRKPDILRQAMEELGPILYLDIDDALTGLPGDWPEGEVCFRSGEQSHMLVYESSCLLLRPGDLSRRFLALWEEQCAGLDPGKGDHGAMVRAATHARWGPRSVSDRRWGSTDGVPWELNGLVAKELSSGRGGLNCPRCARRYPKMFAGCELTCVRCSKRVMPE